MKICTPHRKTPIAAAGQYWLRATALVCNPMPKVHRNAMRKTVAQYRFTRGVPTMPRPVSMAFCCRDEKLTLLSPRRPAHGGSKELLLSDSCKTPDIVN